MRRADSLENTLMLGNIEGRKRRGRQRMRWLNGITDLMDMGLVESGSWLWTGRPGVLWFMGSQKVGHDSATELILISVLYWAHLCMKYSLGISNFLEKISSLSYSIVFFYLFALIAEEDFLISPCYSLELSLSWVYLSFSPLPFASLLFSAICEASSDSHFAFVHVFYFGMVLVTTSCTMLQTSVHSSSGTLSDLIPWIYLSLLYNHKGFDLGHIWIA